MSSIKKKIKGSVRRGMSAFLYLVEQAKPENPILNPINIIWQNSRNDGAIFMQEHIEHAMILPERPDIWTYSYEKADKDGLLMEFGVFKGRSINYFANLMKKAKDNRSIYGFDSFEGIEEDWVGHFQKKHGYTLHHKMPPVSDNVKLIAGWVQDSVPPFLKENTGHISFMHIDTDTYTPCKFLLEETHIAYVI